jgi:hypothetical protein
MYVYALFLSKFVDNYIRNAVFTFVFDTNLYRAWGELLAVVNDVAVSRVLETTGETWDIFMI